MMTPLGSANAAASAAPARARRLRAATALAATPRRSQIGWSDLAAWPDWAEYAEAEREALMWRIGAWSQAGALRRCIDGRVLKQVGEGLGQPAFERLLASAGEGVDGGSELQAETLDAQLAAAGREAALAAVPSPVLRVVLRELFWPATLPPVPGLAPALAQRAVAEGSAR